RELDRWRTLDHPNIASPIGVALHVSNLPALVAPAYPTIARFLAKSPETDVLQLIQGVASALSYLHAQAPIPHGDLKGSSIFISPTGTPLLSDIGIAAIPQPDWGFHGVDDARWLAPEVMDPALRPGVDTGGARAFRTPDGRMPVTPESDVYAFGMLAYEAPPPRAPLFLPLTKPQLYTRARPFASQSPQLTDAVWNLIQLCWVHNYRTGVRLPPPFFIQKR
ncbi:kinase-like domain-containing protein, partial [Mycena vulgaris]